MKSKITSPIWLDRLLHHLMPNIGTVLVVAALLFANNVYAANLHTDTLPSTISYQGTLSTAGGAAINTNVGLTFRLYDVQAGGTALWTETHSGVPVNNGLFNVLLGSITSIPYSVWNNSAVYLGIQVEGDSAELSPREVVSAVPIAMKITSAKLQFIQSGSYFWSSSLPDWSLSTGTGYRSYRQSVVFAKPFQDVPQVIVSLISLDINPAYGSRLSLYTENITPTGFDIVIHTWADTVVWAAGASWVAYADQ